MGSEQELRKKDVIIERWKRKCAKLREKSLAENKLAKDLAYDLYLQKYLTQTEKKMVDILQRERDDFKRKYEEASKNIERLIARQLNEQ